MKWLKRLIVLVIVLVLLAVGGLYLALNGIVKSVVESQGTEQLKVPTTLGSVSLGLIKGTLGLNTFALGSPSGFTAPQMFAVGKMDVDTGGISNLRNQPIHIATINIDAPLLVVEEANGKINFKELINGLSHEPDNNPTPTTASGKPAKKFIIDSLAMSNAVVRLQGSLPGISKSIDAKLPDFTMEKIGNADGNNSGVAIKDVAIAIITKMVSEATHSKDVPAAVSVLLTGDLTDVQGKLTVEAQKQLGKLKLPGALNDAAGGAANDVINQGMGLFKKDGGNTQKK